MQFLGSQAVTFSFGASKNPGSATLPLTPPKGTAQTTICLQSFTLEYTGNNQYGFGEQSILLYLNPAAPAIPQQAGCKVVLRDNHTDTREWDGSVVALVSYYGVSAAGN